ncbi:MAG TPA: hypothetical protein VI357_13800 [Mycobacteriales bacterium]
MAELPRHPDEGHGAGPDPARRGTPWRTISCVALAVVVVAAAAVLHLTGVLGAEAHS